MQQKNIGLKYIGEGSYAKVYEYHDNFIDKIYAIKCAKDDLNEKELERFKREFQQLKKLKSQNIIEVYSYNDEKNAYTMEYMDYTLYDYIQKYNSTIKLQLRKDIANQIIKAFTYIHSKELLHRDISHTNILLKIYDNDNDIVAKVADFGLVKIPNSTLTTANTEFKGIFNDPSLKIEGFDNYNILHEIYALTILLYYTMTGKTNIYNIKDIQQKEFVEKGVNPNKSLRYKNILELKIGFDNLSANIVEPKYSMESFDDEYEKIDPIDRMAGKGEKIQII